MSSVIEYTYLLFWNSFWTVAPVIGIGLFDRLADDTVLMALPELYRFGREGRWFSLRIFIIYMLDGVYQSVIIYFIIQYAYFSPTARADGFDVGLFEFSTTMVLAAVIVADLFNGLNTNVWTAWVFFTTFIGIILVWVYTAVYSAISPGTLASFAYGNDHYLFRSAYFWLSLPITILLSLLPRYLAKAWKFGYMPDDIDIVRWNRKMDPQRDLGRDAYFAGPLAAKQSTSRPMSIADSVATMERRPPVEPLTGSRTDMSTGQRSVHRGFDFATEEGGVAMRRIQTNLSERRQSNRNLPLADAEQPTRKGSLRLFSIRRATRKKPASPKPASPRKSQ